MACLPESDSESGTSLQICQQKRSQEQEPVELGIAGLKKKSGQYKYIVN